MRCHYCSREADVTASSGGVTVGLCEDHFEQRLEALAEAEPLVDLVENVETE